MMTNVLQPRKRRKLARHIPQDKYSVGKRDAEVVELADIQYEFALLDAQLELIKRWPSLAGSIGGHCQDRFIYRSAYDLIVRRTPIVTRVCCA